MLLTTESDLPSPVSASDVSDPSASFSIPFDQDNAIRNDFDAPSEPAKFSVAMANVFIAVNDGLASDSMRQHELVEQSLAHWCSASRTGSYE